MPDGCATGKTAPAPVASPATDDVEAALSAIGCVVYGWDVASDALSWSRNAAYVLSPSHADQFSTGRALMDASRAADDGPGCLALILASTDADTGAGVPYGSTCHITVQTADGARTIWVADNGRWFSGPDGRPIRAYGTLHVLDNVAGLSTTGGIDALTGLVNRSRMMELLDATLARSVPPGPHAFVVVAIDHLGRINDGLGYWVGDEILHAVAKRLRSVATPAALARFSGNKIALLIQNIEPRELHGLLADLVAAVRAAPIPTSAGPIPISVTIGAVLAPSGVASAEVIADRAREALDYAKQRERGSFHVHERSQAREDIRRTNLRLTDEIVRALQDQRISLALQPVAETRSRAVAFYEALARITPTPGGNPGETGRIMAEAEKLGLMAVLDRHILCLALSAMRTNPTLRLSVNVSPSSLTDKEWLDLFSQEVDADVGARLIMELTETAAVQDVKAAQAFFRTARSRGARLAIDDFGAGATSFRTLRTLGVDLVKIDGSFVLNMTQNDDDRVFVRTLIQLARQLGLKTVAEWVQNERAAEMLAEDGCDYIQGALTGLAVPLKG